MPVVAILLLAVISPTIVAEATTDDGTRLRGNLVACTQEGVELLLNGNETAAAFLPRFSARGESCRTQAQPARESGAAG